MDEEEKADWTYDVRIDAQPWMVRLVRDSLSGALRWHGRIELADTAALLLSEIASNGITHTGGPVTVRVHWQAGRLRVSVRDESPAFPMRYEPCAEAEGGRGLLLVDACAAAWGVRESPTGVGKVVWFELW
ncbi:ATP-binding protein [Streptomyces sp. NBC_01262]|uniref:ATP-binding protein n=1 Tax=Streptomyces sp. NBC_01262 TaxID=2903803 RepID=UPI002E370AA7|nr:ATP-binding protein [Streptomyces sp. NBC_01262]